MQRWPIIFHMKLLLPLVLRIHDVIKFTFYHPSRMLKHIKPFPAQESCLAISAEHVLLFEDVLAPSLHEETDASAAPLLGPRSDKYSVICSPATGQQ